MSILLTPVEARVLGALIEKDMATPEYYPLSMNALVNACNQKSNRDPVVSYDPDIVARAIDSLRDRKIALEITGADHRVPKYGHRASETLDLGNRELALLSVLLLRGPQTTAELKSRAERLHPFDDLESVEACLLRLAERQPEPLAAQLARQPGMREHRWTHLLCGPPAEASPESTTVPEDPRPDRLAALETAVESLRAEVADLRGRLDAFRRQFD